MPNIKYHYVKKPNLKGKIRIPYTLDELSNYCDDVTRKHKNVKQEIIKYRKTKSYNHAYPLQAVVNLLEAIKRAEDYIENTLTQKNNEEEFYV